MWNRTLNGENNHSVNVPLGRFNWLFMDYGNLKVTPADPYWRASKMHRKFPFKSFRVEMHLQKCSKRISFAIIFCLHSIKARDIFKAQHLKENYIFNRERQKVPFDYPNFNWGRKLACWDNLGYRQLCKKENLEIIKKILFSLFTRLCSFIH